MILVEQTRRNAFTRSLIARVSKPEVVMRHDTLQDPEQLVTTDETGGKKRTAYRMRGQKTEDDIVHAW